MGLKIAVTKAPVPPTERFAAVEDRDQGGDGERGGRGRNTKLAINQGVYVDEVQAKSAASEAGILPGDVLLQLGAYRVGSTEDVATLLKTVKQAIGVPIVVVRGTVLGRGVIQLK